MPQETVENQNSNQEELKILITGDKPKNLLVGNSPAALAYSRKMSDALETVSERALAQIIKDNPDKKIVLLSGLELGIEQSAARRASEMGIEVRAFIPHKEHGKNWTSDSQKQYQELTRQIIEKGGSVERSDKEYSPRRTQLRDYRMVDEAQIIVSLHNPSETPAHQKTLDYAAKHSKTVLNIWNDAEKTLGEVSKNLEDKQAQNFAEGKVEPAKKTDKRTTQKFIPPTLEIRERITREDLSAERDKIFLFGDNLKQTGYGGQAKEMRGEENARGIPTKKEPSNRETSFFTDKEFGANVKAIDEAFKRIPADKTIVIPKGGIGTGLANLEEKAPRTFDYLNQKLAEIGFDNRRGLAIPLAPYSENKVVIQIPSEKPATATRLLDLNNIQTGELKLLSPTREEIDALKTNRGEALAEYATRLRGDYKENKNGLRSGLKIVSDALDKGEQITVACNCRTSGEMCHADVVKMAIEKINSHVRNQEIQQTSRSENESRNSQQATKNDSLEKLENKTNPRTLKTIAEIFAVSETDKLLAQINETDGRNQSEQASHLGKFSQFVRDIYERGGNVVDGKLIVPKENLSLAPPLLLTTQDYAVKKLSDILNQESKAKDLAPQILEYGNKIAGTTADGETKLKVFTWMYDALEGKSEFLVKEANRAENKEQKFDDALAEISRLADEMQWLEPLDKIEFAPLKEFELESETVQEHAQDENRQIEEIYENAISRDAAERDEQFFEEQLNHERDLERDAGGKIISEGYERIDLSGNAAPSLPAEFSASETERLLVETLPDIDRQLENGVAVKEILKPFHENVRQSARIDSLNRLEAIYQKQKISELETKLSNPQTSFAQKEKLESEIVRWQTLVLTPTGEEMREILAGVRENHFKGKKTITGASGKADELSQGVKNQIEKIDVRRQNVIELRAPSEFFAAQESAEKTFYQKTKTQDANLRLKLEQIRENKENSGDKTKEVELKKQLNDLRELKPNFAFKLESSSEIIVGEASTNLLEERAFVSSYINFQLKQPETRFRHESVRYRDYAARLEAAENRDEVIKVSSDIRAENAALGMKWKDLAKEDKEKIARPLTNREMQFLFTEISPKHYTPEMTVAKLSYAHSGISRRQITEALLKGEIKPSAEAGKLIESLEARLERRELKDSIQATKHFFESLKTPNENLKYKNSFDHQETYRKLPPQERDFVYKRTTQQKENLEYRLAFKQQELIKDNSMRREDSSKIQQSKTEKSFHLLSAFNQARILGETVETSPLASTEIGERDFRAAGLILQNQPVEKISNLGQELKQGGSLEDRKIGEILETFSKAEVTKSNDKTTVEIKLPENSLIKAETYQELLERFYPNDARENDKFKFSSFHEKTLHTARIKGQDETLKMRQTEIGDNFYSADKPAAQIFQTEQALFEDLTNVAQMQQAARAARSENAQLLEKYASRTAFKMQNQKTPAPRIEEQKQIVKSALYLSSKNANLESSSINRQFFGLLQKEISISDFGRFAANEKIIAENQTGIRKTFADASAKEKILEESRISPAKIFTKDKLALNYFNTQTQAENRLLTQAARTAFEQDAAQNLEGKTIGDLISQSVKEEIKIESFAAARIALEPEYRNFEETNYNAQTLKLADAIETAHELSKAGAPPSEIAQAFEIAENDRTVLLEADNGVKKSEGKPLSLSLYEAEIGRAEKELWTKNLGAKILAGVDYSEIELTLNLDKIFSTSESEQMKIEAAEIAKSRLEPKELDADHRKIPTEAGRQALMTFKQLEQAHQIFQFSNDKLKINEAFAKLDLEAGRLNKFRQDYSKTEKFALLRDGVKSDLVDLLRKNQTLSGTDLTERTSEILRQNFAKAGVSGFAQSGRQTEILSREISEKIKTKQIAAKKEAVLLSERSPQLTEQNGKHEMQFEMQTAKDQKAKESFVLAR